jgi:predicted RNA-binding Zn ribbon-like protein
VERAETTGRIFDLSGGALCLDFANTLDDRPAPRPHEYLGSYADLLTFARQASALDDGQLARLHAHALRRPADAAASLARALELREVIYRLFRALAEGKTVAPTDLASLNRSLAEALAQARLVEAQLPTPGHHPDAIEHRAGQRGRGRFTWSWADDPVDLDMPLWPVARSAADLPTSSNLSALRLCAAESCAWLFLDTSRNGSRRSLVQHADLRQPRQGPPAPRPSPCCEYRQCRRRRLTPSVLLAPVRRDGRKVMRS